jgi:hypothetical protein
MATEDTHVVKLADGLIMVGVHWSKSVHSRVSDAHTVRQRSSDMLLQPAWAHVRNAAGRSSPAGLAAVTKALLGVPWNFAATQHSRSDGDKSGGGLEQDLKLAGAKVRSSASTRGAWPGEGPSKAEVESPHLQLRNSNRCRARNLPTAACPQRCVVSAADPSVASQHGLERCVHEKHGRL